MRRVTNKKYFLLRSAFNEVNPCLDSMLGKKLWENNVIFSITLNYQVSGEKTRKLQSTYAYRNVSPRTLLLEIII